jgi:hypothetical protein
VVTHIFLSIAACHLLVAIEKTLLDQGVHTSPSRSRCDARSITRAWAAACRRM